MDQTPNQPTPSAAPQPTPVQPAVQLSEADKKDIEQNKVMAVLAYFGILCLIPLLAAKQSKFAQFHAKQGLVLFGAVVALTVVSSMIRVYALSSLVSIASLVASIYGIIEAWKGNYWEMPYLGQYAKKINL